MLTERVATLPYRPYAALLATAGVLAFLSGAVINFDYARNNPGADPYASPPKVSPVPVLSPDASFVLDPAKVMVMPGLESPDEAHIAMTSGAAKTAKAARNYVGVWTYEPFAARGDGRVVQASNDELFAAGDQSAKMLPASVSGAGSSASRILNWPDSNSATLRPDKLEPGPTPTPGVVNPWMRP